ncbi:hypothetical protein Nepgr_012441 [Nepenthes gracilis]|uniref:Uncharacterized protein n=1 Tax=Nepenthes gracilis TaxID=150966 RepID=A0AAD3SGX6_NEPGR|nr:hypothetical protein Nepgr_012441 [Nepenthes gracilis]
MPTEAAVEEAPTVDSTPSPHDVHRDMDPDVDSACRIASDVERLRKQLVEIKEQRCLDLHLPCCTQAARESILDGSSFGCEAVVQGISLLGANSSSSCPQGPPVGWIVDELFAKQALFLRNDEAAQLYADAVRMPGQLVWLSWSRGLCRLEFWLLKMQGSPMVGFLPACLFRDLIVCCFWDNAVLDGHPWTGDTNTMSLAHIHTSASAKPQGQSTAASNLANFQYHQHRPLARDNTEMYQDLSSPVAAPSV